MIEAKELRLGNLLTNFLGESFEVNIETLRAFATGHHEFGAPQPIPFTEEWLIKFGFTVRNFVMNDQHKEPFIKTVDYKIAVSDFELEYESITVLKDDPNHKSSNIFKLIGNGGYDEPGELDLTNQVQYVHQLQNLFFALTGKELTIKEHVNNALHNL